MSKFEQYIGSLLIIITKTTGFICWLMAIYLPILKIAPKINFFNFQLNYSPISYTIIFLLIGIVFFSIEI